MRSITSSPVSTGSQRLHCAEDAIGVRARAGMAHTFRTLAAAGHVDRVRCNKSYLFVIIYYLNVRAYALKPRRPVSKRDRLSWTISLGRQAGADSTAVACAAVLLAPDKPGLIVICRLVLISRAVSGSIIRRHRHYEIA